MAFFEPTKVEAKIIKVIDGDTIHVTINDQLEKLRLMGIDTEESHDDDDQEQNQGEKGGKPITKLGNQAKSRARELVHEGDIVTLVFPDDKPLEEALAAHRGNYGRLLCFLELEDAGDFQEIMIREGWSPYFTKYGFAELPDKHFAYQNAEALAQAEGRGIWSDQLFNYKQKRYYEKLIPWWSLRANIIKNYRIYNENFPNKKILNSRKDYDEIKTIAQNNEGIEITIFTELRYISLVSESSAIIQNGSQEQPLVLFIPDIFGSEGQKILALLNKRYLTLGYDGSDLIKAGTDYVYITGQLKMYEAKPEIIMTRAEQFSDAPKI